MSAVARILVPSLDWARPAPGVRKLYHHVDVLNANGIDAFVMHQQPGFRCSWFDNRTAVRSYDQVGQPRPGDIFMVPEILAWQFVDLWPGTPKAIFSQNAYQTFAGRAEQFNANPYLHPDFRAVITVSQDSVSYLRYAFPKQVVLRIRYSIDRGIFHFAADKKRQLVVMPGNKEKDGIQVLAILKYRGVLGGWGVAQLRDKTETEAAQILRESALCLNFGTQEGWGLAPMEAMACGCLTIGYDGRGSAEFFKEPYATPIESEDIPAFAAAAQRAIREIESDPQGILERTRRTSQYVCETYPPALESDDIMAAWQTILALINDRP
jgi:hypothetical protein